MLEHHLPQTTLVADFHDRQSLS